MRQPSDPNTVLQFNFLLIRDKRSQLIDVCFYNEKFHVSCSRNNRKFPRIAIKCFFPWKAVSFAREFFNLRDFAKLFDGMKTAILRVPFDFAKLCSSFS